MTGFTFLILIGTFWQGYQVRLGNEYANRAWLAVNGANIELPDLELNIMPFKLHYLNVGREPAVAVAPTAKIFFRDAPTPDGSGDPSAPENSSCFDLQPREKGDVVYPAPAQAFTQKYGVPINPELATHLQGIKSGREIMFLVGCVGYKTFGRLHHSAFCYFWRKAPPTEFAALDCPTENYVD